MDVRAAARATRTPKLALLHRYRDLSREGARCCVIFATPDHGGLRSTSDVLDKYMFDALALFALYKKTQLTFSKRHRAERTPLPSCTLVNIAAAPSSATSIQTSSSIALFHASSSSGPYSSSSSSSAGCASSRGSASGAQASASSLSMPPPSSSVSASWSSWLSGALCRTLRRGLACQWCLRTFRGP